MNIYWKIGTYVLAAAAVLAGLHFYGAGKYDQGFADREAIAVKTALAAEEKAREQEKAWSNQLNEARDEAIKREKKLSADAATARATAAGLRGDLADQRRQLPGLTEQAVRRYADAANIVLGECTSEYQSLAEVADRIDSDRQTLEAAWPK